MSDRPTLPTNRVASITSETGNQSTTRCPEGKVLVGIEFNEENPYLKRVTRIKCASIDENRNPQGPTFRGSFVPVQNGGVDGGTARTMECPAGTVTESLFATQIGGMSPNLVASDSIMLCRNLCTGALAGAARVTTSQSALPNQSNLSGQSGSALHGSSLNLGFAIPRIEAPRIPNIPSIRDIPRVPGINFDDVPVLNYVPDVIDLGADVVVGGGNYIVGFNTEMINAMTHPLDTVTNLPGTAFTVLTGGQLSAGGQAQIEYTFDQKRVGCPTGEANPATEGMDYQGGVPGITAVTVAHADDAVSNITFECGRVTGQGGIGLCPTTQVNGSAQGSGAGSSATQNRSAPVLPGGLSVAEAGASNQSSPNQFSPNQSSPNQATPTQATNQGSGSSNTTIIIIVVVVVVALIAIIGVAAAILKASRSRNTNNQTMKPPQ